MGENFYRVTAQMPPQGVRVRVIWGGRGPFEAARTRHPQTKQPCWVTMDANRGAVFLPTRHVSDPAKPYAGWHTLRGDAPEVFAPLAPEKWREQLPPVAFCRETDQPARMWSSKQEFNAAEAAAEMESDREFVSRGTSVEQKGVRVAQQWWRDHALIRYEERASLSMRMVEGRIMRAVACCGYGKGLTLKNQTFSGIITAMAQAVEEATRDATADYAPRLEQLPADRDDFLTAMGWFTVIDPPSGDWGFSRRQRVLLLRAIPMPWSFDEIGDEYGVSGERARQLYASGLARGFQAAKRGERPAWDKIEALRDRNRRAKRARTAEVA